MKSNGMFCGSAGIRVRHLGCSRIESEHRITQRMYLWRYSGAVKHWSMGTTDRSTGIGTGADWEVGIYQIESSDVIG